MMKKSTFGAVLAFLFAAAGALTAAALYLRRREKELDEYERLLYSDMPADGEEEDDEETSYEPISTEPGNTAEEENTEL
ncbi:MAG: phosphatase [Gemmiger sp.]|uniref:phosphatase n=1 Tax=Gemmiger sp. TaxID=2049027 RepID=UPI002E79A938|nr:phosphatase [Gemmiger sp.]MEE0801024.1 phosphatase [Gemmiger sp.]